MRKLILALAASLLPALASAQLSATAAVQLHLDLPVVLPALVVVTPGVQVVPDVEEEVFFVDGWYWVRQPNGWYRSRSHKHGWMLMPRGVPARLVSIPAGKYKRYKPAKQHHDEGNHGGGNHGGGNHGAGNHGGGNGKHGGKH